VKNPKKILIGHELNQVVKCEGSLIEGKEKNTNMVNMMKIACGMNTVMKITR